MNEILNEKLKPGDLLALTNQTAGGISVTISTDGGTEVRASLPPGGHVELTAGREQIHVVLNSGDPPRHQTR